MSPDPTNGFRPPETVYGIDFGVGSRDAGRSTWIVELDASSPGGASDATERDGWTGTNDTTETSDPTDTNGRTGGANTETDGTDDRTDRNAGPHVTACAPLADRLDCSPARENALPALAAFLADTPGVAVGLDFPFGLPVEVLPADVGDWQEFLAWFAERVRSGDFDGPKALSAWGTDRAREETDGDRAYLPRRTDAATDAQCAYGFIGTYPTFYGLRDLLVPLVHDPPEPRVRVAPVMEPTHGPDAPDAASAADPPLFLETYPAAIHETRGVHRESYKDSTAAARDRRVANRDALLADVNATITPAARDRIAEDTGGDALDALAAAVAAYANTRDSQGLRPADVTERERIEATIYR